MLYLFTRYGHFAVGVAALIRDENGRILVVHRTYSNDEPWALPGGWLEMSDTRIEQALERELLEETGLRIEVQGVRAVERSGFAIVLLLEARLLDAADQFKPSAEVNEVAWAEPNEVGGLSHVNARLLRRALA